MQVVGDYGGNCGNVNVKRTMDVVPLACINELRAQRCFFFASCGILTWLSRVESSRRDVRTCFRVVRDFLLSAQRKMSRKGGDEDSRAVARRKREERISSGSSTDIPPTQSAKTFGELS